MAEAATNGDVSTAMPGHSENHRKGLASKEKERKEIAIEFTHEGVPWWCSD